MLDTGFKFMFTGLHQEKSGNNFRDHRKYAYEVYLIQAWYWDMAVNFLSREMLFAKWYF